MVIEVLINGEVLTHEELPPGAMDDIPGATWQENVQARELIVRMHLEQVRQKLNRFFNREFQVEYRLVFPSKMTNETGES